MIKLNYCPMWILSLLAQEKHICTSNFLRSEAWESRFKWPALFNDSQSEACGSLQNSMFIESAKDFLNQSLWDV